MKMKNDSAHQSNWEIAEVIFGVPFLISIALNFLVPLPLSQGVLRLVLLLAGIILIVGGIALVVRTRRLFTHFHQRTDPGHPTSKVITSGIFAMSRNPLYLTCAIIFLGFALALNMLWALMGLLLSVILCHYLLILPEERYLTAKFGEEYKQYMASVHRWFGRR
jgi:protein-S-isoprenylcysteine O-methyltransferase Ste14